MKRPESVMAWTIWIMSALLVAICVRGCTIRAAWSGLAVAHRTWGAPPDVVRRLERLWLIQEEDADA